MAENVPYQYGAGNTEGKQSAMDRSTHRDTDVKKPWHTPMDSVGPAVTPKPSMTHALDMIQQLSQPQYEGHGNLDTGMPEGQNLMRRAVDYMNKNPR